MHQSPWLIIWFLRFLSNWKRCLWHRMVKLIRKHCQSRLHSQRIWKNPRLLCRRRFLKSLQTLWRMIFLELTQVFTGRGCLLSVPWSFVFWSQRNSEWLWKPVISTKTIRWRNWKNMWCLHRRSEPMKREKFTLLPAPRRVFLQSAWRILRVRYTIFRSCLNWKALLTFRSCQMPFLRWSLHIRICWQRFI